MRKRAASFVFYFALCLLFSSCAEYDPDGTGGVGSITFDVKWEDAPSITSEVSFPNEVSSPAITSPDLSGQRGYADSGQTLKSEAPLMTVSNCTDVSTVEATVYSSLGSSLASGGPWACSAHSGTISNVPAGSSRKAVILGKDSSGNIKYRGEQTGITVTAGQTANAGTITASSFSPTTVTATAGNAQVTISWTAVSGATSYNIYWSTTTGVKKTTGTKILNVTSPYSHTGRTNGTTYFYVVTAVDAQGESAESTQVSGKPTATTFTLTVTKSGTGSGTVISSPTGINCGATCSSSFTSDTAITLTATATTGSTFAGWGGDADCSDGQVTMNASKTCTATFNPQSPGQFTLNIAKAGTGSGTVTSSPIGINCGVDCTEAYSSGTVVTLTATADAGSVFAGFTGGCVSSTTTCTLTMTADTSVTATFNTAPVTTFTLTLTKSGTGSGTVTSSPAGISCGTTCSASFNSGTSVTLTATPAIGSIFSGWSGGGCIGTGTCTVTMNTAMSITATFNLTPAGTFVLTVTKAGTGSGTVTSSPLGIDCGATCSASFNSGTSVTLTATPATGSTFAGWSGGGCTGTGTCIVTMSATTTVTATFNILPPPAPTGVTATPGNAQVTISWSPVSGATSYNLYMASVTGVTKANWSTLPDGMQHTNVTSPFIHTGLVNGTTYYFVVTAVNAAGESAESAQVSATPIAPAFTLAVTKAGTGSGTVTSSPAGISCGATCSASFNSGAAVTLTATPDAGSSFSGWSGGGCTGTGTCIVTMNAATTVTATFNLAPPGTFTLTITKTGTGTGTVTSSPAGINCGATCSASFTSGTSVTLTATPAIGSIFAGWSGGGCTGTGTCAVTMSAATTVTATFDFSGTWSSTGSMATARVEHTATLLPNGKVLIAGGCQNTACDTAALASVELYDPATGTWSATGSLATARGIHTETLLPNGKVLVVGGRQSFGVFPMSAELYDPGTGTWSSAGNMSTSRHGHTTTLLPNGKVLVAGGLASWPSAPLASAELYDPATGLWTSTGSRTTGRGWSAAIVLPNGKVLVAGGSPATDTNGFSGSTAVELYDPTTGIWTVTGSMATARRSPVLTLLPNGMVLVAGGNSPSPFSLASAELYDPAFGTWSPTGSLTTPRGSPTYMSHTAALLPNGKVLVTGGCGASCDTLLSSADLYDPVTGIWSSAGNMAAARVQHTATLLPNGKVLVAGGWIGGTAFLSSAELYTPTPSSLPPPTLTVTKAGTGSGVVTSSPAGINCGLDCSEPYNIGTLVTLTATPDVGFTFSGWSGGGCIGTGTCTVTLNAATTVTATFNTGATLTVTKSGAGFGTVTSSPTGISCGATCSASFTSGTVVTLTATPDVGSVFAGWSGGGCTGTGTCTVTMNAATTVTATFNTAPVTTFTLTVTKAGTGTGTVTSSPAGISCGATCSASYNSGASVTLTATPDAGSTFAGWSGGGCTGTGTCTVTISAATTVTATFNTAPVTTFTLTVTKAGTGTGTVTSSPAGISCGATCSASFTSGTVVTLTATPAAGSIFTGWSGGGCTGTGTCAVTISAATTVTATFNLQTFTLTVTKAGTGSGIVTSLPAGISCGVDCTEVYNSGTSVTLTAAPDAGSIFSGWSGGGCTGTGTCIVTMNAAMSITATFNLTPAGTFVLTVTKAGTGSGTVTSLPAGISCGVDCTEAYNSGTVVTLTATPATGSIFSGWSGDSDCSDGIVTMDVIKTCTATFTGTASLYFTDNFENGLGNWLVSGQDWGLTTSTYRSAGNSITDSPSGNYLPNTNASITLKNSINLTSSTNPVLTFWHKYSLGNGGTCCGPNDQAIVQISTDGGSTWLNPPLASWSDSTISTWNFVQIDLSSYKISPIKIRFILSANSNTVVGDGWYIDDVKINEIGTAKATIEDLETGIQELSTENREDSSSAFGCGSIDLHGGSGPGDPGNAAGLIPLLLLPLIIKLWRKMRSSGLSWYRYTE